MQYQLVFLPGLRHYSDISLLIMRLVVGSFLIWGVLDNILGVERMREFESFLQGFGFAFPAFMARLSVWAQLLIGLAFISGFVTRWAGIVCTVNFAVAIVMVDSASGIRASFPSACLIVIGLYLATYGAGRFSADHFISRPNNQTSQ